MAHEVSSGSIEKYKGKWRGRLRWREVSEDGTPGPWHTISKTWDIKSYKDEPNTSKDERDTRGSKKAAGELAKWRDEVAADLDRKEREGRSLAEAESTGRNDTVSKALERYLKSKSTKDKDGRAEIQDSTASTYRYTKAHITDYLGNVRLCDLNAARVARWVSDMKRDKLGISTREKAHSLLYAMCEQLTNTDVMDKNPCKATRGDHPEINPVAMAAGDVARLNTLLDSWGPGPLSPFPVSVKMALNTGMREAEISALRWRDVTLEGDNPHIHVCRAFGRAGGKLYVKDCKNHQDRVIPVTPELLKILKARRALMVDQCEELETALDPNTYVTGDAGGKFYHPGMLGKRWASYADEHGVVGYDRKGETHALTFHGLRHTYATLALGAGMEYHVLQSILGHSSITITMNTYVTTMDAPKRAAMEKAAKTLNKRAPKREKAEVIPLMNGTNGSAR
jgi:integrase